MKVIYKYTLLPKEGSILIHEDFKILSLQQQNNIPCMWAEVELNNPKKYFEYYMFMTGEEIPINFTGKYIGTIQIQDGSLVLHVCIILF